MITYRGLRGGLINTSKGEKKTSSSTLHRMGPTPWWDAPAAVVVAGPKAKRTVRVDQDTGGESSSGAFGCDVRDFDGRRKRSSTPVSQQIGLTSSFASALPDTAAFEAALAQCPRLVVNITATWCASCVRFHPKYLDMSAAFPDVAFVCVDIDTLEDAVIARSQIETVPSFLFFRDGKEVSRLVGVAHKRPGKAIAVAIREHLLSEHRADRRHTRGRGQGL